MFLRTSLGLGSLVAAGLAAPLAAQTTLYEHDSWGPDLGFGFNVCAIGDIDGDKVPDYLISTLKAGGFVDVVSGNTGELIERLHETGCYGMGLAGLGDLNGDGVPDFAVGSPREDSGLAVSAGLVRVYSGVDRSVLYTLGGDQSSARFGIALGNAGDIDGDGVDDLVVGSWWDDFQLLDMGSADVFSGATGAHLFQMRGTQTEEWFGTSVTGAGDVNGDGFRDVMVGAPFRWYNDIAVPGGTAQIFSGFDGALLRTYSGQNPRDYFGTSVALLPDIDGDGVGDHAVGAPRYAEGGVEKGAVFVYSGATGQQLTKMVGGVESRFGTRVSSAGDVDGDGKPDIVVGACACINLGPKTPANGAFEVRDALSGALIQRVEGPANVGFAYSVAAIGDVNRDGRADVLIGNHWDDTLGAQTGSAQVVSVDSLPMRASEHLIGISAGGGVDLELDFGTTNAGRHYLVVGSAKGNAPGRTYSGVPFALTFDTYSAQTIKFANSHHLVNTYGTLDSLGRASARVQTSPGILAPSLAGQSFWYATAVIDQHVVVDASNTVPVTLLP